jgi:hypothetical protein
MTILNDKSKLHFQPLLFDGFKYKSPNSTYQDHYTHTQSKQFAIINKKFAQQSQRAKSRALSQGRPANFVQNNINAFKKKYDIVELAKESYTEYERLANTPIRYQTSVSYAPIQSHTQNITVINDDNYNKKYQHVRHLSTCF